MQLDHRVRVVLLVAVIALGLPGATVSTTTGSFTDEETMSLDELEAASDRTDSPNTDNESQSNETLDDDGTESDDESSGEENGTGVGENGNRTDAPDEESDAGEMTADDSRNVSATESSERDADEPAPDAASRR